MLTIRPRKPLCQKRERHCKILFYLTTAPYALLMCLSVCLGCCADEFGSSAGTYELPCISVFAFITRVEIVYEVFGLHYKLWENRDITERYVYGRS
jgi:hypothetical protein